MDLRKAAEMAATDLEELIYWHGVRDSNDKLMPAHNQTPEIKSAMESLEVLRQSLAQPEQRGHCTCGDPEALGVVHFRTRPCFHYTEPLLQPEQEPVAWMVYSLDGKSVCVTDNPQDFTATHRALPLWTRPFELREKQKPVAWRHWFTADGESFPKLSQYPITNQDEPLYTAPPKREWVGLTIREIEWCFEDASGSNIVAARNIEAKLKEKNT